MQNLIYRRRDPSRLATWLWKVEKYTEPPIVKLCDHASCQNIVQEFNKMLHDYQARDVL